MTAADSIPGKNALAARLASCLQIALIVLACLLANYPSLQCFFFADDFLCLNYLYRIFHGEPFLFLVRLLSPWQDISVSRLYRPLCDLIFACNYLIAGPSPWIYHLSNLGLHCLNAVLLFHLVPKLFAYFRVYLYPAVPLFAALIFAAYPLHVEPIVWIVGNSDLAACGFALGALICFLKAQKAGRTLSKASLFFLFLALLCKESAACLPVLVFLIIVLRFFSIRQDQGEQLSILGSLKLLFPFLLVFFAYFILRFLILGTFIGGYSGSLGDLFAEGVLDRFLNPNTYLLLAMGANLAFDDGSSKTVALLHAAYGMIALILMLRSFSEPWDRKSLFLVLFLILAFFAALLPVYRVFGVSGVLSNSRILYFPSCFLSAFLAAVVFPTAPLLPEPRQKVFVWRLCSCAGWLSLTTIFFCFAFMSLSNYQPWLEGSKSILSLQKQLKAELTKLPANKKLFLVDLMPNWRGAHLLYEYDELETLLGPNFFPDGSPENLLAIGDFPNFYTASSARVASSCCDHEKYQCYYFDHFKNSLESLSFSGRKDKDEPSSQLVQTAFIENQELTKDRNAYSCRLKLKQPLHFNEDSIIEIKTHWLKPGVREMISFGFTEPGKEIASADFSAASPGPRAAGDFSFHYTALDLRNSLGKGPAQYLSIRLPLFCRLKEVLVYPGFYAAKLTADPEGLIELGNGNYRPLSKGGTFRLNLDVSSIAQAEKMLLEHAEPPYTFNAGKLCMRDPIPGEHLLESKSFDSRLLNLDIDSSKLSPSRHAYRLIALDRQGDRLAFYSDTICIDLRSNAFKKTYADKNSSKKTSSSKTSSKKNFSSKNSL